MPIGLLKDILSEKPEFGRLMGIDQGEKRIGIAVCDPMQQIATAVDMVPKTKFSLYVKDIKAISSEYEVKGFIIGYPLNMDGSEGPRCDSVKDFAKNLKDSGLFDPDPWIAFYDERLSTSAVEDFLIEDIDMNRKRRKEVIDKLAARHILQGAIDSF